MFYTVPEDNMAERGKIAVLMTCHNRVETTLRCLEALFANRACELDVWLVDDASSDGTGRIVKERYPQVDIIAGTGSLFWGRGMRLAWKTALESGREYAWFLWLNDDVVLKPSAIEGLLEDFAACGGGRSVVVGACSADESERRSSYGATDEKDIRYEPDGRAPRRAAGWFNGNVVLVPAATCREIGIISGDYSHSRADYDYAERLKRAGIPFYASSRFAGRCADTAADSWLPGPFMARVRLLVRPGNCNIRDLWLYMRRYRGFFRALVSTAHLVAVVLFGRKSANA